ncbi:AP2/B3-like transcriptional factor family protein isoform X2 [Tasmannia lanceolata]|uniref:AP2/B3-like transcriptional factor family protein isoform X2 n=1 Tax=Tasmannia lanceolata TaxID=3420 RepID=UPI0040638BD4
MYSFFFSFPLNLSIQKMRDPNPNPNPKLEDPMDDEDSIFYDNGDFGSLPDFPSLSSSSTSSLSTRSSSASSASWAGFKPENGETLEKEHQIHDLAVDQNLDHDLAVDLSLDHDLTVDPMGVDVFEGLGDMDMWDPSSLFDDDEEENNFVHEENQKEKRKEEDQNIENPSEDLAKIFLEWLKSNKESISPEDLRSIKLKRSTIEDATRRLGGGKEGMIQLLKLILAWVQSHHLQKKNCTNQGFSYQNPLFPLHAPFPNPNLNPNPWTSPQTPYISNPTVPHVLMGYEGGVLPSAISPSDYQMIDSNGTNFGAPYFDPSTPSHFIGGFSNQYNENQMFLGNGERFLKLGASATKEARKKRMARQRRFFSHHHNHHGHRHQNQHHLRVSSENNCTNTNQKNPNSWVVWSSSSSSSSLPPPPPVQSETNFQVPDPTGIQQRQIPFDRPQGWKPEKNIRFLLQKVLKQSDVGNLGRIVLPKEAETHLPELDARDGISIAMEDIGTSRIWNMRYRFWPNNKSRMYLLENTGDFVRSNGLQEGDFIVIYSDIKCTKYMIRGVKVRKTESVKNPGKTQKKLHGNGAQSSSSAMEPN